MNNVTGDIKYVTSAAQYTQSKLFHWIFIQMKLKYLLQITNKNGEKILRIENILNREKLHN